MTAKRPPRAAKRHQVQWVAGLAVCLLCAGFLSLFASVAPDGLEWVAGQLGFAETATAHAGAAGPLAGYQVSGVDDARLSGGLAGVVGSLIVLAVSTAVLWMARRRRSAPAA